MPSAALYIRVSTSDQVDGYSLDAQRHAGRIFARSRSYDVVAEYADEGLSAHTDNLAKRPAFSRLLADAEAGRFEIIVVHKMDRFTRKLRVLLECVERLRRAKVTVVSVSEPDFDFATPTGFLGMGIMGTISEWYSRNLSEETKKGWAQRKRSGLYAGRLPFGVRKSDAGIPEPDPATHAGLLLAFESAASGLTDAEVADVLHAAGYRPNATARRARFTKDALRVILQNRFYVGELPAGKRGKDGWLPGAHQPIVAPSLFDQAQQQRTRRAQEHRVHHITTNGSVHVLSGLVRCADCGEPMHLGGRAGVPRLWCTGRRQNSGCPAPSVKESELVADVGEYLAGLHIPDDARATIIAEYRAESPERIDQTRRRKNLEAKLRKLSDMYLDGDYERTDYEQRRAVLRAELAALEPTAAHGSPDALSELERVIADTKALWDHASDGARNELLRALFTAIDVQNQRVVAVHPRPEFQPYFVLSAGQGNTPAPDSEPGWQRRARGDSTARLQPLFNLAAVMVEL